MQIRAAQMTALSRIRKAAFLSRLRQFIQDKTQRAPESDALADLFERGLRYGLITEQQFAGYIMLAWQSGVRPPASDPKWIAEVMNDPYRLADAKVKTLFDRASSRAEGQA
jgi:hypothetical protein